jgi:hypothetical protein
LLGALAAVPAATLAQGITVIDSRNDSGPGLAFDDVNRTLEMRTVLTLETSTVEGNRAHLRQRFSFMAGGRAYPGGDPFGATVGPADIGWSLELRVDDPQNQGYTLEVTSRLRGLLGVGLNEFLANTQSQANLPAMRLQVWEAFAAAPIALPQASSPSRSLQVDDLGSERRLVTFTGEQALGSFVGTRRFLFQLAPEALYAHLSNSLGGGHTWLQFGEAPTLPGLEISLPSAGEPSLTEMGHVFELEARFQPVPEPAAWLLLALGLPLVLRCPKRRRAWCIGGARGASAQGCSPPVQGERSISGSPGQATCTTLSQAPANGPWPRVAAMLTLLLAVPVALAQALSLSGRDTRQTGTFAVGAGTTTDNGNYLLDLVTPDLSFANVGTDSGAAAGAGASFLTAQAYTVLPGRVEFSGSAVTTVQAPAGVTSFADALSDLELLLVLAVPTPFEFRVDVVEILGTAVNGLAPRANTQVRFSGPGDVWIVDAPGSFVQTGVLAAGTWSISAFADARGNGDARFGGALTLVPEPAAWALMALGMAAIGFTRCGARAARAFDNGSTPS